MKKQNHSNAFTLIELLVVIAIIGILSSVVLASLSGARESARDTRRQQDMRQIMTAIELYRNQNGYIPGRGGSCDVDNDGSLDSTKLSDGSSCLVQELETVMPSVPTDPISDSTFYYAYDSSHGNNSNACGGEVGATLSFNESETGIDDRETTIGADENQDDAAWNRMICWN